MRWATSWVLLAVGRPVPMSGKAGLSLSDGGVPLIGATPTGRYVEWWGRVVAAAVQTLQHTNCPDRCFSARTGPLRTVASCAADGWRFLSVWHIVAAGPLFGLLFGLLEVPAGDLSGWVGRRALDIEAIHDRYVARTL